MYVCQTICTSSAIVAGQVRIRRSSSQSHGHTSRKKNSAVILPPLRFSECMNTTAQTASTLRHPGAACKHNDGKLSVPLIACTHSRVVDLRSEGSLLLLYFRYFFSYPVVNHNGKWRWSFGLLSTKALFYIPINDARPPFRRHFFIIYELFICFRVCLLPY